MIFFRETPPRLFALTHFMKNKIVFVPQPSLKKIFSKSALSYDNFLTILLICRNASAPGINAIPYKVYKKYPKSSKYLLGNFKCSFNKCETPLEWPSAGEVCIPQFKTPWSPRFLIFAQ